MRIMTLSCRHLTRQSSKAEHYGIVLGASTAIGVVEDIGLWGLRVRASRDTPAPTGISNEEVWGHVRHGELNQLWLQEMLAVERWTCTLRRVRTL